MPDKIRGLIPYVLFGALCFLLLAESMSLRI